MLNMRGRNNQIFWAVCARALARVCRVRAAAPLLWPVARSAAMHHAPTHPGHLRSALPLHIGGATYRWGADNSTTHAAFFVRAAMRLFFRRVLHAGALGPESLARIGPHTVPSLAQNANTRIGHRTRDAPLETAPIEKIYSPAL